MYGITKLMLELNNPSVAEDQRKFRKLMKEQQADLAPIVDKRYKQAKQDCGGQPCASR